MVTDDPDLAESLRVIASHGSRERYFHDVVGVNSRLDTLQAAILRVKLPHLDTWNERRRQAAARYTELLAGMPVTPPAVARLSGHIYHQYTLRVPRRDGLAAFLKAEGVPHAVYYPVPLHLQKAYEAAGFRRGDFPVAETAAEEVISLPMHSELTAEQQAFVADRIRRFYSA